MINDGNLEAIIIDVATSNYVEILSFIATLIWRILFKKFSEVRNFIIKYEMFIFCFILFMLLTGFDTILLYNGILKFLIEERKILWNWPRMQETLVQVSYRFSLFDGFILWWMFNAFLCYDIVLAKRKYQVAIHHRFWGEVGLIIYQVLSNCCM